MTQNRTHEPRSRWELLTETGAGTPCSVHRSGVSAAGYRVCDDAGNAYTFERRSGGMRLSGVH
ncbi:MAG: hypothetical protein ACJ8AH_12490 [Stellaceae bacterium]